MNVIFSPGTISEKEIDVAAQVIWGPWKMTTQFDSIIASHVIYAKHNLSIMECSINKEKFVMKIRYPYAAHERESGKFLDMIDCLNNNGPASLFPKLYSLVKLSMPTKKFWGGICMEKVQYSVLSLLYPSAIAREDAEENKRVLAHLSSQFLARPITSNFEDDRGVYVKRVESRNLQTSLVAACLELLHRFHGFGWVHGDSHLGNFVFDAEKWKVYIIDPERSFQILSTNHDADSVKFLDVQELLGHASGALVTYPDAQSWDFHNVLGVVVRLHPSFQGKNHFLDKKALSMLPVCSCFSFEHTIEKLSGCVCCKSAKNKAVAKDFQKHGLEFVNSLMTISLKAVRMYVKAARDSCIKECGEMEASLLSCGPDLASYLETETYETLQFDIEIVEEDMGERDNYDVWVRKVLYLGAFVSSWKDKCKKLAAHLHIHGHIKLAHDLLLASSG